MSIEQCPNCDTGVEVVDKELGEFELDEIIDHLAGDNRVQCVELAKYDSYIVANTNRNEVMVDDVRSGSVKILIIQM
jgi:hypothetical protein